MSERGTIEERNAREGERREVQDEKEVAKDETKEERRLPCEREGEDGRERG